MLNRRSILLLSLNQKNILLLDLDKRIFFLNQIKGVTVYKEKTRIYLE